MAKFLDNINTILSIFINAKALLGGGIVIGCILGFFSPIVSIIGIPLAIIVGISITLIMVLIGIIFYEKIQKRKNTDKTPNRAIINTLKDIFLPDEFVSKLIDKDIENMVGAYINHNANLFEYKGKGKICCSTKQLSKINEKYQKLKLDFLPKIAKKATFVFEIDDKEINNFSFFIKIDDDIKEIDKYSKTITLDFQDEHNHMSVEYMSKYTGNSDNLVLEKGLIIYIKSFVYN